MLATIIALSVAATPSTAEEGSAANPPPPAPPSAADTVVAAAFTQVIGTKAPELESNAGSLVAPGLALVALAALAFALSRRKSTSTRNITVLERASLGPKRSIVVADVMGERLVLGVSEAGIAVLSTRPAPAPEPQPYVIPAPTPVVTAAPKMGFFDRVLGRVPAAPASFDEALRDSVEDQELRAKLALGQRSVVP